MTILISIRHPPAPRWIGEVLRWMRYLHVWSLLEVMMLGILVALVKIAELARVDVGIGIFSVGALTVLFPAIIASFDSGEVWKRIEWPAPKCGTILPGKPPGASHESSMAERRTGGRRCLRGM